MKKNLKKRGKNLKMEEFLGRGIEK